MNRIWISRNSSIPIREQLSAQILFGSVSQRNPENRKWRDGLAACDLIAADVVCAKELPKKYKPIVLRLVSDAFLVRTRQHVTAGKV